VRRPTVGAAIDAENDPQRRRGLLDNVRVKVEVRDGAILLETAGVWIAVRHVGEKPANDVVMGAREGECRAPRNARRPGVEAEDAMITILIEFGVARVVVCIEGSDSGRRTSWLLPQSGH